MLIVKIRLNQFISIHLFQYIFILFSNQQQNVCKPFKLVNLKLYLYYFLEGLGTI